MSSALVDALAEWLAHKRGQLEARAVCLEFGGGPDIGTASLQMYSSKFDCSAQVWNTGFVDIDYRNVASGNDVVSSHMERAGPAQLIAELNRLAREL